MITQGIVLAIVLVLLVFWVRSRRGREARELLRRVPWIWAVPLALWGLTWLLDEVDMGPLNDPVIVFPRIPIFLTGVSLLLMALGLTASYVVLASLSRAAGHGPSPFGRCAIGLLLGQALFWAVMLALFWVFLEYFTLAAVWLLLATICLLVVPGNVLLARLLVRLFSGLRWKETLARPFRPERPVERPILCTVLLRLLVTGAIVIVWIQGHESHTTKVTVEGTRTTTTSKTTVRTAYNLYVDVQSVATVTCDNPWPVKVAAAVEDTPPVALRRGLDLLTAFLSVLFLAGLVASRAAGAVPGPEET